MGNPKPLDGDDVYEKLGVSKIRTREEILDIAKDLKNKKEMKLKGMRAKGNQNDPEFEKETDRLLAIRDAIEEIERNHPEDGYTPPTELVLSVLTSDLAVNETARFRVSSDDGPEGNVDLTAGNRSATTRSNGEAPIEFKSAGTVTVSADKDGNYNGDTATVSVSPRTIDLQLADCPDELEVGETGTVRVTDGEGSGISKVAISNDETQLARTDGSGTAPVTFSSTGEKLVEADARDTNDVTYAADQGTITVTEKTVELNLGISSEPKVGEEVAFRVTNDHDRTVEEAVVDATGGPSGVTGPAGETTLTFEEATTYEVTVSKEDDLDVTYVDKSVSLPVGRGDATLTIGETEGEFVDGNEVSIRIVDDNDIGVPDVSITTNHGHDDSTDDDGWVQLTLRNADDLELSAEKDSETYDYDGIDAAIITVIEYHPEILLKNVPDVAAPGEALEVAVVDENDDGIEGVEIKSTGQNATWTTDHDGTARITVMDEGGIETFSADKQETDFLNRRAKERVVVQS